MRIAGTSRAPRCRATLTCRWTRSGAPWTRLPHARLRRTRRVGRKPRNDDSRSHQPRSISTVRRLNSAGFRLCAAASRSWCPPCFSRFSHYRSCPGCQRFVCSQCPPDRAVAQRPPREVRNRERSAQPFRKTCHTHAISGRQPQALPELGPEHEQFARVLPAITAVAMAPRHQTPPCLSPHQTARRDTIAGGSSPFPIIFRSG